MNNIDFGAAVHADIVTMPLNHHANPVEDNPVSIMLRESGDEPLQHIHLGMGRLPR